tara:strand:- start:277 stop:1062 length:786 start_codon:yes stop_codon:yes gene_type:complete
MLNEVAPPGFGHTKSGKGDKKGGTAAAFDRARKEGRFKGSKSDMFAIMWSQKNKGDKPHYKPGTDKKYKKYQTEGSLHKWFKGSKSKDGKAGWVNVKTGGTCASDEPGEGTPKCVSSSKRASMTKAERDSASRRKKAADPNQQQKSGAAKPTYVATDKKKVKEEMSPMQDNNLFGNAYAGSYETLKKKIGSKKKHNKPAIQEGSFKQYMADAQAARDRQAKKVEDRKKKDAQFVDTKTKGVRFYDKKGKGRIKSGKKIYDK